MKKFKILILLVLALSLTACKQDKKVIDNEQLSEEENILMKVLENNKSYTLKDLYYTDTNKEEKISDFINRYVSGEEYTLKYSLEDFDGDLEDEMVIMLDSYDIMYLILNIYNGKIYGYEDVARGLMNLKKDGTHIGSGGADVTYITKINFDKEERDDTFLASFDEGIYKVGEETVQEEKYQSFLNEFKELEDAKFIEYK